MTGNPIASVQDVLEGLMGLPSLRELSLDLTSESEANLLLQALPRLQSLNGRRLAGDGDPRQDADLDGRQEAFESESQAEGYRREPSFESMKVTNADAEKAAVRFPDPRTSSNTSAKLWLMQAKAPKPIWLEAWTNTSRK